MIPRKSIYALSLAACAVPFVASAHTNTVGFRISPSSVTSCVGGAGTTCFDVEVFYGSWHSGTLRAEGDLALFLQTPGGGETQVIGQSAVGGTQTPFSMAHSLTSQIPNSVSGTTYNYSTVPSSDYTNLSGAFSLGTNYFFTNSGNVLGGTPDGSTNNLYSHQSAVGVGLGPGTYRIAYDSATSGSLSQTWQPVPSVQTATFTITAGGGVVVNTGGPPSVSLSAPPGTQTGPFTVTATFSEPVSGASLSDFVIAGGTASNFVMVAPNVYTFTMSPSPSASAVSIDLPANTVIDADTNANTASNTLNVAITATPGLTAAEKEEIRKAVVREEVKTLRAQLHRNQRMAGRARDRFQLGQRCRASDDDTRETTPRLEFECQDIVSKNTPFDVDGTLSVTQGNLDLRGSFFGERGTFDGSRRRLVFGEFEVIDDDDAGAIGILDGRIAWEQMTSDDTMIGYFVGAEIARSEVEGGYTGDRDRFGVSVGAYFVHEFGSGLLFDGLAAVDFGRNQITMSNGVFDVDTDYSTTSLQLGAALSGHKEYESFDLYPELALSYGYTSIGDIPFDARAIGFNASGSLDAGYVELAIVSLTPEFRFPMSYPGDAFDFGEFRVSPSARCEFLDTGDASTDCGAGIEFELSGRSRDGNRELAGRVFGESIGSSVRKGASVSMEFLF